jgi:hypothetical protein
MIKSWRMIWAVHVARTGIREMHIGYWWESQKEIDPLRRPRRRWVDNINMDLTVLGWDGMDWIEVAQDRD